MNFNLAIKEDRDEAFNYLTKLVAKDARVKITKVNPKRTLNQNAYLHLIIGYFGMQIGYTLEEAKQIYKAVNKDIYDYRKNGQRFTRSSADLDKEEMATTITKFRDWSNDHGVPLPAAENAEWLSLIENEIEKSQYYLRG